MDKNINFTNIYEHFKYLIETAEDKEVFRENLLKDILVDYEDALDEKLNKFIELVLEAYPIMFSNVKAKKTKKNKYNFLSKVKNIDKVLKELFLSEVDEGDFTAAADTIYKKKLYTNNHKCSELETWNYWMNIEISISDMMKLLEKDIINYIDHKKVKAKVLKKYLRQEIVLRISGLSPQEKNYNNTHEFISYVKEEKKLIAEEILLDFEHGRTPEEIWNSF